MKSVHFHPAAENELYEAAEFYEKKVYELGTDFLNEVLRFSL